MNKENVYEEVYEILSYMDKITVMKIPLDLLTTIKNLRNKDFKTNINKNEVFNENNISKEAVDLLCWLDYTYWKSDEEKREIDKIIKEKEQIIELEKRQKYNPDNLFKKDKISEENNNSENVYLVEYKKVTFFQKIKQFIKNFFRK